MPRRLASLLLATGALAAGCGSADAAPRPWPLDRLELGLMDAEGGAAALADAMPLGLRYHYLAGGVNTGNPWQDWGRGDGRFVTDYVDESRAAGMVPVFTYYELRQSQPGAGEGDEATAFLRNLGSRSTMRAYFGNLRLLFERLGAAAGPVVLHVEPDLWGFVQQRRGDDASAVRARVASTGVPDLKGLPNTVRGVAQAIVRLRNRHAPRVVLGYALSIWGTNKDIAISNEPPGAVDALARRSVRFHRSLRAPFDVVFAEFTDRTSGYRQVRDGASAAEAWWDRDDFTRHARFLRRVRAGTRRPVVLWQIPLGNTVMRTLDNRPHHYQDNRVQWLLDPANRYRKLRAYRDAGVVALLFGPGQGDDTHAVDRAGDGVTNPAPITGNRRRATHADDDGGFFRARARAYARHGALSLRR